MWWIVGIGLVGWDWFGWYGGFVENWMCFDDCRVVLVVFVLFVVYFVLVLLFVSGVVGWVI